jgi:hypothetical protein
MRNLAIGVAILSILPLLAEGADVMHVKWEDLPMVQGTTVRIFLPGGFITGKADSVEADALVVNVKKTSDPNAYPKGMLRAPREKLHRLEMQTKGKTGRIVLTSLGIVLGFAGGVAVAVGLEDCPYIFAPCRNKHAVAANFAVIGLTAAGIAGGYFAGNVLDNRWTAIEIEP